MEAKPTRTAGVHLDHGRKHYGGPFIQRLLERMAELGLGELQLHVSENQGYRLPSDRRPEVVSEVHLSRDEIAAVRETAGELGIAIVPSLDVPGHAGQILRAHPELQLGDGLGGLVPNALDLTLPTAWQLVADLHDDLAELFPDSDTWHIGFDEIIPVEAPGSAALLAERARARLGDDATEHDETTYQANRVIAAVAERGIRPRVWNDALFRSSFETLDQRAVITWWTNWHPLMAPLEVALAAGHDIINCNDQALYYVLGEAAGYAYPTPELIREVDWDPGVLPTLPDGIPQRLAPDDHRVAGSMFAIWSDLPDAQSPDEVFAGIEAPLAEYAARALA